METVFGRRPRAVLTGQGRALEGPAASLATGWLRLEQIVLLSRCQLWECQPASQPPLRGGL